MTDIKKLVKLLNKAENICDNTHDCDSCKYVLSGSCKNALIADYLLANGVFLLPEDLRGTQDFSISAFIEAMQMYKEKDRYIKTPCKVGDKVYLIGVFTGQIIETKVVGIHHNESGIYLCLENFTTVSIDQQFGKTVFLTKEEAEEKLKELKENA